MEIRSAKISDAEELLSIYAPYVIDTAITFEYDVPTTEEFRERIENTLKKYPYLCAVENGKILGYAYATTFKERAAYQWSVELSIYVEKKARRQGVGRKLYEALEKELKKNGISNLYACIAVPVQEADEYLNFDSENFHARLGFKKVGTFTKCARKFGRFYSMIWMEKFI